MEKPPAEDEFYGINRRLYKKYNCNHADPTRKSFLSRGTPVLIEYLWQRVSAHTTRTQQSEWCLRNSSPPQTQHFGVIASTRSRIHSFRWDLYQPDSIRQQGSLTLYQRCRSGKFGYGHPALLHPQIKRWHYFGVRVSVRVWQPAPCDSKVLSPIGRS